MEINFMLRLCKCPSNSLILVASHDLVQLGFYLVIIYIHQNFVHDPKINWLTLY